jgi:hypothetical protein
MALEPQKTVVVEDARILWRNFSGIERPPYNKAGERNFVVVLDPKVAEQMFKDGWNVKFPEPSAEGDERDPHIQVKVNFEKRPPRVVMITSTGRKELNKDTVDILDAVDFQTVDLIFNASQWEVNGKTGIKAYLKSMYVTIEEDYLDRKYAQVEEA